MSGVIYLALLVAVLVATVVVMDRRWKTYQAGCQACLDRAALDGLVADGEREMEALAVGLRVLAPSNVIPMQRTASE